MERKITTSIKTYPIRRIKIKKRAQKSKKKIKLTKNSIKSPKINWEYYLTGFDSNFKINFYIRRCSKLQ